MKKHFCNNIHKLYAIILGFVSVIGWMLNLFILDLSSYYYQGLLIANIIFSTMWIIACLTTQYWICDDKRVTSKCFLCVFATIEWKDVSHIELRELERMRGDLTLPYPTYIKEECYVFFSKTKTLKDDNKYKNRRGYALRVLNHQYIEEAIEKYYHGEIIDKRT